MSRQYIIPGGGFVNETGTTEYIIPGVGFVGETTGNIIELSGTSAFASSTPFPSLVVTRNLLAQCEMVSSISIPSLAVLRELVAQADFVTYLPDLSLDLGAGMGMVLVITRNLSGLTPWVSYLPNIALDITGAESINDIITFLRRHRRK